MSLIYTGKPASRPDDAPVVVPITLAQWIDYQRLRLAAMREPDGRGNRGAFRLLRVGEAERN